MCYTPDCDGDFADVVPRAAFCVCDVTRLTMEVQVTIVTSRRVHLGILRQHRGLDTEHGPGEGGHSVDSAEDQRHCCDDCQSSYGLHLIFLQ